jgi:hypothetical protein
MGNDRISWWRCKFCGAHLFYSTEYEQLERVITAHFQRCVEVNRQIVAMFLRMAEQQKANQQNKEKRS